MDVGIDTEKTNPFEPGDDNLGGDEDIELHPMTSSRRGSVDPTSLHKTYEETSFGGDASDTAPLIQREGKRDDALDTIKRREKVKEMTLGIELSVNFQTLIRLIQLSMLR